MNITIPHIKQTNETSCGAAALAMVYAHYGVANQNEATIWNRLKEPRSLNPSEEFIRTPNLAKDVKAFGLHYVYGQAVWEEEEKALNLLDEFIKIRVPVIVCQKFEDKRPFGHFRIVTGFTKNYVKLSDPYLDEPVSKMKKDNFFSMWQATSDEVIGGEFVAVLDDKQCQKLGEIIVHTFWADIDYYRAGNLHFQSIA
jgi:predicted double-glycine peptidase